jgi:macrolide transport system ATP-binding/permease protein
MSLVQDVRFGIRMLRKSPTFTMAAVLALGLGVGANTTVFTWLKAVLLAPLPGVTEGDRLVTLSSARGEAQGYSTRYGDYLYFREHSRVFAGLAAYELAPVNLAGDGKPEIALAGLVTADYFSTLGVRPALGRFFRPEEGQGVGAHPVAVLSYALWRRLFAAGSRGEAPTPRQTVSLDRHPYTVIGVAPADFMGSYGGIAQDLWVPITQEPQLVAGGDLITTGRYPVQITGRLKPGVTLARVQAELDVLSRRQAQVDPKLAGWREVAFPLARAQRGFTSSLLPVVEALMAVVGVVLVIACLNVANLLLARALARRREITIRLALGAGRGRLVRQMLAESLLLAALGGAAGEGIAALAARALPALLPPLGVPLGFNLAVDSQVLGFTALIAIVTIFVFGLLPAVQASRVETSDALKDDSAAVTTGRRHSALRHGLVVVQLGLSLTSLIAAGLVGKSLLRSLAQPPGFAPDNLLLTSFDLFMGGYDQQRGSELYRELLDRVRALPGVQSASLTDYAPLGLSGGGNLAPVRVPGHVARPGEDTSFVLDAVGPRYLRTLGIALAAGRDFDAGDRAGARPVAIVNSTFARQFFPAGTAVGRHVEVRGIDREVVGVVRDYKYRSLAEDPSPQLLVPFLQDYRAEMILVVRTAGEPLGLLPALRQAVAGLDPGLPLFQTMSFRQRLGSSLFAQRILTELLAALGLLAAVLAAVGLFGVMSYFVGQRPREIGIRMALGARRGEVLWMVLARGFRLVAGGIALGFAAAAAAARLLAGLLPGLGSFEPAVFAGVAAGLAAVALLACYLPAWRAASMEPFAALRHE